MGKMMKKLRAWWANLQPNRRVVYRDVACGLYGVSLVERRGEKAVEEKVAWDDIAFVFAYKLDCLTFDKICLALADASRNVRMQVTEDDAGYPMLIEQLPTYLSGCLAPADWFMRVTFPAFETQWTELYRRRAEETPEG